MSRAQQGDVLNTATGENTSYNTDAQKAFGDAQSDVGSYANAVGAFKAANPYVQGGSVETADNQATADTAAGLAQSTGATLQGAAVRGGQNAGAPIAATEQMQEANERALVGQEAQQTKDRAAANTGYQGAVVGDTGNIETMQDKLATEQAASAQGALGTEEQAAQTPSFLDELGSGLIQAGDSFAGGFGAAACPARGSLYLMADGGWKLAENLMVGDEVMSIGGDPQTILDIRMERLPVVRVKVGVDGISREVRNSYSHGFAAPLGGFIEASRSIDKRVVTDRGVEQILGLTADGEDTVFNVITDGSHTYCADGVWAVGEAA